MWPLLCCFHLVFHHYDTVVNIVRRSKYSVLKAYNFILCELLAQTRKTSQLKHVYHFLAAPQEAEYINATRQFGTLHVYMQMYK